MNFCYAKTVISTLLHVAIVDDVMLLIIQRREKFILALAGHLIVDRKVSQCVGRVDTADTRDQLRECGRIRNDRINVRSIFDPSKFGIWQRLTHRPSVQIIHVVIHKVR